MIGYLFRIDTALFVVKVCRKGNIALRLVWVRQVLSAVSDTHCERVTAAMTADGGVCNNSRSTTNCRCFRSALTLRNRL